MERRIGKNAPCPCESGKKYKRCCLPKEAAAEPSSPPPLEIPDLGPEETHRVSPYFLKQLLESEELPDLLNLPGIDFGVHLFDPYLDDLGDPLGPGSPDPKELLLRIELGVQKHVTDEVRSGLAAEIEAQAQRSRKARALKLAYAAVRGLEDTGIESLRIGVLLRLYLRYITLHALERQEFLRAEERNLDPALRERAQKARDERTEGEYLELAASLEPLGSDALPYVELAIEDSDVDERISPLVALLASNPSMRSARLLERLLRHSMTDKLKDLLFSALGHLSEWTVPNLLYRIRDPGTEWVERWAAYEFLVGQEVWDAGDFLMDELMGDGLWEDPFPDGEVRAIVDLLVELGDRRAIGAVVNAAGGGKLRPPVIEALKQSFEKNGWWKEVEEGLANLRRDVIVVVPRGMDLTDVIREKLEKDTAPTVEAANFRMGIWSQEWNRAYHEDLHWLRPCDIGGPGRRELQLMQEFTEWFRARVSDWPPNTSGEALSKEFSAQQGVWMVTPQKKLGGWVPLAVILEEKRTHSPPYARNYNESYRRRKLQDLYTYARALADDGQEDMARRELEAILQIDPEHAFARKLLHRVK